MSAVQERALLNAPCSYMRDNVVFQATVDLEWSITDPLVVRATFRTAFGDVSWDLSRDLLAGGIGAEHPVGASDVTVWAFSPISTRVRLSSPEGLADVLIPTNLLTPFVDACEDACQAGSGLEAERLSAWVEALLMTLDGAE